AFVAVSVHLEQNGEPLAMILDIVESHSGENLAVAFEKILKEFGISKKVSTNRRTRTILTK
ncbi:hypothetical protein P692DRAFT_20727458, partial [Suillus brevipes Sb2]